MILLQGFEQARISPLEAHDGLLQITDREGRNAGLAQPPQQGELQRVRVLEFVHYQAVDPACQGFENVGPLPQQTLCRRNHVRVVDQPGVSFRVLVVDQCFLACHEQRFEVALRVAQRTGMPDQIVCRIRYLRGQFDVVFRQRGATRFRP